MPNQTDIQQLIQQLTPGAINNGNPNTVYNTAGTPMQPPVPMAPPPTMNADGTMNMNTMPTTAPIMSLLPVRTSAELGAWVAPPVVNNRPQFRLPDFGQPQGGGGGTEVPVPSPVTPEPSTPTLPGVTTGGGDFGLGGFSGTGEWNPPVGGGLFGAESPFSGHFSVYDPEFRSFYGPGALAPQVRREMGYDEETGTLDPQKTEEYLQKVAPKDESGGIDIAQTFDMLTELFPLLNGVDLYDPDTGKWKLKENALQIAMNALGIGPVFNFLKKLVNRFRTTERLKNKPSPFSPRAELAPGPNAWGRVLYDINPEIPEGDVFVRTPQQL